MAPTTLLVAIAVISLLLYIWEEIDELIFIIQSKARGFGLPYRKYSRPFGIYNTYRQIKRLRNHRIDKNMKEMFLDCGKTTVRGQGLMTKNTVTIDPENIKAILATNFKDFDLGSRHRQLFPLLGNGIFTLSGEGWKHSRAMLRPQFAREQVTDLDINFRHTTTLIQVCKKLSTEGDGVFDIQELFYELTLDTATEFLFGKSVNCLGHSAQAVLPGLNMTPAQFVQSFNFSLAYLAKRFQLNNFSFLLNSSDFQSHVKICHQFVDYFVQRALRQTEKEKTHGRYVFIEELCRQTRDPVVIRDQALNILLAGRDTTAYTLSCCLYRLGANKAIFEKLREVVLAEYGETIETLTFESLKKCQYLNHFVNEVLRLHPAVPFNFRQAIRDTSIPRGGGPDESEPLLIRKGERVAYMTHLMHRSEKFWGPTATMFRPERWAEDAPHTWEFLPFNGGPRICLGQQLALIEINYTLVRLLQNFKSVTYFERGQVEPGEEPLLCFKLTGSLADGCWVKLGE